MLSLRALFLVTVPVLASCSFTNDFDRFSFSGRDSGPDAAENEVDSGPAVYVPLPCAAQTLVDGVAVDLTTVDQGDDFASTCGGAGSADVLVEFVAPATTYYRITTAGSAIDTILSVLDPVCDVTATEKACDNDDGVSPTSELLLPLTAGERILIVVDGNAVEGAVKLVAERIACPSTLLALGTPINHTTVGRPDDHSNSCGGSGGGDNAYRFVPAVDGFYSFLATKVLATTRTIVTVEDGAECGGAMLQCNRGGDGRSEVIKFLRAGQTVTVWVDAVDAGSNGTYSVVATLRPGQVCAESGAPTGTGTTYTVTKTDPHRFTTSCGATSVWWYGRTDPNEIRNFPDRSFGFVAPNNSNGCSFWTNVTITARFPFAAALVDGNTCGGPELECYGSPTRDDTTPSAPVWRQTIQIDGVVPGSPRERTIIIDRVLLDNQGGAIGDPSGDSLTIDVNGIGVC